MTHPDGRLQRVRPSVPHPGATRRLAVARGLAARLGHETGIDLGTRGARGDRRRRAVLRQASPEEIGGTGVRWQEQRRPEPSRRKVTRKCVLARFQATTAPGSNGALRLGTYRDLWAAEVTGARAACRLLLPGQTLELSLTDPSGWESDQGDEVNVRSNGHSVRARVAVRERMRPARVPDRGPRRAERERCGGRHDRDHEGGR